MQNTVCELHFHTMESSYCGHVSAVDSIPLYKKNGYDLVCVTDHYNYDYFTEYRNGSISWSQAVKKRLLGYETAKRVGDECGVTVLLAAEFRFPDYSNDYLVYGITPEMMLDHPELHELSLSEFSDFAKKNDIVVIQAHPFRYGQTIMPVKYIDGVEAYNSHPLHNAHNAVAEKYAELNNLIATAGQDFHQYPAMLGCKTLFHGEIRSLSDLKTKLRSRDFEIIKPEHPAIYND